MLSINADFNWRLFPDSIRRAGTRGGTKWRRDCSHDALLLRQHHVRPLCFILFFPFYSRCYEPPKRRREDVAGCSCGQGTYLAYGLAVPNITPEVAMPRFL